MKNRLLLVLFIFLAPTIKAQTKETVETLEARYQSCLDKGVNMLGCSQDYYYQIDSLLNIVYKKLKKQRSPAQFSLLKKEQLQWLSKRDAYFGNMKLESEENELSAEDKKMVLMDKKSQFVQQRVLELIEQFKN